MPLYDFQCSECGNEFEELAAPDCTGGERCPSCGSTETERQLSAHCQIPGTGPNRVPGGLLRGGGAKVEKVPLRTKPLKKPIPKTAGCGRPGGCGGCGSTPKTS